MLDNADGQLARTTGRISAFGRYLDSECDLLDERGDLRRARLRDRPAVPGRRAFLVLTLVLSVNFNVERIARGTAAMPSEAGLLARVYRVLTRRRIASSSGCSRVRSGGAR